MLILTRKVGENILIDRGQIQVKVLFENDGVITLGVQAPSHIDIDRQEIFMQKLINQNASQRLGA